MGSAMMDMMFRDACMNLSNGIVNPLDKDILSYAPLPNSVIDPFITQEVDPLQTMNLTNNTLKVWVEESKKANYFTTHFVTLSRMIMNGVATMARGLVTLHMRGEDLDQAPLSIQDLLSISSYQFRKSYIGVLQTVKSKPEVSERLLMNQLRWNNTLIKLFKTREKLERPVVSGQSSVISAQRLENDEGKNNNEIPHIDLESSNASDDEKALHEAEIKSNGDPNVSNLESGSSEVSSVETDTSPLTELSELPALAAPGAYGAIRPYGPYRNQTEAGIQRLGNEEGSRKNEVRHVDLERSNSGIQRQGTRSTGAENEEGRMKNEVQREDVKCSEFTIQSSNSSNGEKTLPESEIKSAAEPHVSSLNVDSSSLTELSGSQEQGTRSMRKGNEDGRMKNEIDSESSDSGIQKQGTRGQDGSGDEENSSFFPHNSSLNQDSSLDDNSAFPSRPPEYARILYRALCRSSGNEDGALEFTLDEIYQLLADPEFCMYEPQLAADFRKALQSTAP